MKKMTVLSAVLMFLLNFALAGQDPGMPPEGENNEQNKEKIQSAEELYPYVKNLETPIDRNDYATSVKRAEEIAKRVRKAFLLTQEERAAYVKQPANGGGEVRKFDEKEIRTALEEQISREVLGGKSVNPAGKPLEATRMKAREAVQSAVLLKFPKGEETLSEELAEEAEKKYPLAQKGDKVTVQYSSGRSTYRISGTFYGYGIRGKSILINSRAVAVRDLSAQDIAKFSKPDNAALRKRYVDTRLRKYQDDKFKYEKKLADEYLRKQIEENDRNGFIFYGLFKANRLSKALQLKNKEGKLLPEERLKGCVNEWTSADRIITDMAEGMIQVTRKRIEHERRLEERRIAEEKRKQQEEEEKKRQQEGNGKPEDGNPDAKEENPPAE